jgi:hypothetical protein
MHPERHQVLCARTQVEEAVIDDEFLADCIDHELALIAKHVLRQGLVPFFTMPELGVQFAFGYWAPGATPGPHEHTAWTISAVCRNRLEVLTYDRTESYQQRRLVPKNHFQAPAGKVGYIAEPCIHEPKNTSPDWSLSLHLTSPLDGQWPGDYDAAALPGLNQLRRRAASEPDSPYRFVVDARRRNRSIHLLARTIARMNVPQVPELLKRCVALGSAATKEFVHAVRPECDQHVRLGLEGVLVRSHRDLALTPRRAGGMVALVVETPRGLVDDFFVDELAAAATAFVSRETMFRVAELPGNLSDEERIAFADALVESGLFTRRKGKKDD